MNYEKQRDQDIIRVEMERITRERSERQIAEQKASKPKPDYAVKSWPSFFSAMISGEKRHDMRDKRDRDYKVGDVMLLREYDPFGAGYTGRDATFRITYITSNDTPCAMSSAALDNNFAILSVELLAVNA